MNPHVRLNSLSVLAVAAALSVPSVTEAAPTDPSKAVDGLLTLSGTEGRDEIEIDAKSDGGSVNSGPSLVVITPSVPFVAERGSCGTNDDKTTGKPIQLVCFISRDRRVNLVVNLKGGDDQLSVDLSASSGGASRTLTVNGGGGNDIVTSNDFAGVTLNGGEGNDDLESRNNGGVGRASCSFSTVGMDGGDGNDVLRPSGANPCDLRLTGGTGVDLADYSESSVVTNVGRESQDQTLGGGVTATLSRNGATLLMGADNAGTAIRRTDTYAAIEGVIGTPRGDIITGGATDDILAGGGGPDVIEAGDGNDIVNGDAGADSLALGGGADVADGGTGADEFKAGDGGDTYLMRDGFLESVDCGARDTVINDLVDKLGDKEKCSSVQTAQAKDKVDTQLPARATLSSKRVLSVLIQCPAHKPEDCKGSLSLRRSLNGASLAGRRYSLRAGTSRRVKLGLSKADVAALRGGTPTLRAGEVDPDGRKRTLFQRTRIIASIAIS